MTSKNGDVLVLGGIVTSKNGDALVLGGTVTSVNGDCTRPRDTVTSWNVQILVGRVLCGGDGGEVTAAAFGVVKSLWVIVAGAGL